MPYARKDLLVWQKGMYYHIYNRGAHQTAIFREAANYLYVIEKIQKYRKASDIAVVAYCLLPTHYHLMLRQDGEKPASDVPQFTFNSYSKAYNLMYSHSGTLFEGRFRAKVIQSKSHLLHLCRYIHANPVKHGLVADSADWPYSNYLDWIGERRGTLVDHDFIQNQFGGAGEYRRFVQEYLQSRLLPDEVWKSIEELER